MNGIRKNLITAGLFAAVLLTASVWAVTNEEVTKMRAAMPDKPVIKPERPRVMLVFSLCNGFKHSSIPYWAKALDIMAEKTGAFTVEHSVEMAVFAPETLSRFDVVCFNNTTGLTFNDDQKKALMEFIRGGKGIVGIHAATDNFNDWPEAAQMMGGIFTGHPWGAGGTWAFKIDEPTHPLMKSFGGKGFKISDEIYRTAPPLYSRDKQRVLMSLDMSDEATRTAEGVKPEDSDTGISWIKSYGKGRLFYCSLGHNHPLTWTTPVLEHYLAGIQYAMGDLKVDDTPLGKPAAELDKTAAEALIEKVKGYDLGQSRVELTALQDIIRAQSQNAEALKQIETLMQPLLAVESKPAVKEFACRELSVFATELSVPALAALLDAPETEHLARYALERIPAQAADAALLAKLSQVKDANTKAGIITSLGNRRCGEAVGVLSTIAIGFDKPSAHAAIAALGVIATEESTAVLQKMRSLPLPDTKKPILDALAVCGDGLCRSGNPAAAVKIYQSLYSTGNSSLCRIAALNGLEKADPKQFYESLPVAVLSEDKGLQAAAIQHAAHLKDTSTLELVVASFEKLSDTAKVSMLAALATNGSPIGRKVAEEAMSSDSADVRMAGYQALGSIGDGSSVMRLAEAAAKASDRAEKSAAQQALYRLKGKDVTAAIEKGIGQATASPRNEAVAVELLRAVSERGIESAKPLLFMAARDPGDRVAQEALRAIQMVAGPQDMPAMAELLAAKPNAAVENVTVIVAEKIADRNQRGAALLAKLDAADPAAKASFLRVLGRLGDINAVEAIRRMRASSETALSEAAFRAMADWPGADFIKEMRQAATGSGDEAQKVLAFRAYIRMLTVGPDKTEAQAVDELAEAMKLSARPQEQRLVLSALGAYGSPKAMQLAHTAMANPELKSEAEVAVVGISEKLAPADPETAAAALQSVREQTANAALKEKAQTILNDLDKRLGFIVGWQIAGPYTESGKGGAALFDTSFAPETDDGQVQWQAVPTSDDAAKPWLMNIQRLLTGNDRVAYVRAVITAKEDADAVLEIGSDDGVKVWFNGKPVHANNAARPVVPASDKVTVRLVKGDNTVLMKITQQANDWGFCLRVTNPDGSPMRGLSVKK